MILERKKPNNVGRDENENEEQLLEKKNGMSIRPQANCCIYIAWHKAMKIYLVE